MARQLSENIQELLSRKGWKQKDLADRAGIDQPYISRIVRGEKANPSCEVLIAIADALEVSLDELFGREYGRTVPPPPPTPIRAIRSGRDRREPLRALFDGLDNNEYAVLRGGGFPRIKKKLMQVVKEELLEKRA
jgi:transcriptional regulator with XRE-family HTH domain